MKNKEIEISANGFDRNIPATPITIDTRIIIPPAIIFGAAEWKKYANKTPNKALRIHKSLSQINRNIIPRAQQALKIIAPAVISLEFINSVCSVHMRQCFFLDTRTSHPVHVLGHMDTAMPLV